MKRYFAVVNREVASRRTDFIAAAFAAVLPFLVGLLPGVDSDMSNEARPFVAFLIAQIFCAVLGVSLGISVLGRDLYEGRMGFFFSRPLPPLTLWGGKMSAALLVLAAVFLLILTPSFLANVKAPLWKPVFEMNGLPIMLVFIILISAGVNLMGIGHVLSVMLRAKSLWIFLPLSAMVLAAVLIPDERMVTFLFPYPGLVSIVIPLIILAPISALGFLAAGYVQMKFGRADLRRSAKFIAVTLTVFIAVYAMAYGGFVSWAFQARHDDLVTADVVFSSQEGRWVYVSGWETRSTISFRVSFMYNTDAGTWFPLEMTSSEISPHLLAFSRAGNRFAFAVPKFVRQRRSETDVKVLSLESGSPLPCGMPIPLDAPVFDIALSDDGSKVAVVTDSLSVYNVMDGRVIASCRLRPVGRYTRAVFLEDDAIVRVYSILPDENRCGVRELDLQSGVMESYGFLQDVNLDDSGLLRVSRATGRILHTPIRQNADGIRLLDGKTGSLLSRFTFEGAEVNGKAVVLSDGRIAVANQMEDQAQLLLYSAEGEAIEHVATIPGWVAWLSSEFDSGILVAVSKLQETKYAEINKDGWYSFAIELETGALSSLGRFSYPRDFRSFPHLHRAASKISVVQGPARYAFFQGPQDQLMMIDPQNGETRTVLELKKPNSWFFWNQN